MQPYQANLGGKLELEETRELFECPSCFHLEDTGGVRATGNQAKSTFNVKTYRILFPA